MNISTFLKHFNSVFLFSLPFFPSLRKCIIKYNTTIRILLLYFTFVNLNFCLTFKILLKLKVTLHNSKHEIKIDIFALKAAII